MFYSSVITLDCIKNLREPCIAFDTFLAYNLLFEKLLKVKKGSPIFATRYASLSKIVPYPRTNKTLKSCILGGE